MATFLKSGVIPRRELSQCEYTDHENERNSSREAQKLAGVKPKKKCCRSKPRCKRCPLVVHKVHKAELNGIRGKELEKVFKRARKA